DRGSHAAARGHRPRAAPRAGAPPPLPHDQFEPPRHHLPDDDRLQQPHLTNRGSQFLQRILVNVLAGLPRVRRDRPDSDLVEIGPVRLLPLRCDGGGTTQRGTHGFARPASRPGPPTPPRDPRPTPPSPSPPLPSPPP